MTRRSLSSVDRRSQGSSLEAIGWIRDSPNTRSTAGSFGIVGDHSQPGGLQRSLPGSLGCTSTGGLEAGTVRSFTSHTTGVSPSRPTQQTTILGKHDLSPRSRSIAGGDLSGPTYYLSPKPRSKVTRQSPTLPGDESLLTPGTPVARSQSDITKSKGPLTDLIVRTYLKGDQLTGEIWDHSGRRCAGWTCSGFRDVFQASDTASLILASEGKQSLRQFTATLGHFLHCNNKHTYNWLFMDDITHNVNVMDPESFSTEGEQGTVVLRPDFDFQKIELAPRYNEQWSDLAGKACLTDFVERSLRVDVDKNTYNHSDFSEYSKILAQEFKTGSQAALANGLLVDDGESFVNAWALYRRDFMRTAHETQRKLGLEDVFTVELGPDTRSMSSSMWDGLRLYRTERLDCTVAE